MSVQIRVTTVALETLRAWHRGEHLCVFEAGDAHTIQRYEDGVTCPTSKVLDELTTELMVAASRGEIRPAPSTGDYIVANNAARARRRVQGLRPCSDATCETPSNSQCAAVQCEAER